MDRFLELKNISEFKDLINQDKIVFVQFTTKMCHPSDMIKGYIDQLIEKHPNVVFVKVYVDQHTDIASEYNVTTTPNFMFFKKGQKLDEIAGIEHNQISAAFASLTD
ncbi:hypothetical protein CU097_008942 [Rhizopus azygosporus]|uniref:Thioredoxin domain-containing protein n=1 Tax=Rhizopus azygosporus TaxID=86630 RepID=A0A367JGT2_RHIAZ|nr:hypothetical protein CU097_008942 [Rhizopus azygosporus]